jgi:AraC family transcriptional regulator of adaptative response/methylated-DNA-[protein]-cysteine methyltransferase
VLFFEQPQAAEQAGFRACRRCRPELEAAQEPQAELIETLCRYIEAHLEQPLTLAELGAQVGFSPHHLQRTFKRIVGITPRQYADARRLNGLKAQLKEGQPVTEALYEAGYSSSSRLYERSTDQLGMTPATYRRGAKGMQISYTVVECALGSLLVAATERGVCAVSLGDTPTALEQALAHEYPGAQLTRDGAGIGQWVAALIAHLEGRQPYLDLPLDIRATAFQRQVWQQLQAIPYGSICSYGEVARAIGRPGAARAVAQACASNPVALVIPCHRVVGEGGKISGYRWGAQRKRAILEREALGSND